MKFSVPVAEHIAHLNPYVPGKPIAEVQRELGLTDIIKLASNENPLGPSSKAIEAIHATASHIETYPEGSAPALRSAVANLIHVPEEYLVFGNGSDEILHLLALTFLQPGDQTIQGDPSFAMYEIYSHQCNCEVIKIPLQSFTHDLSAMADAVTSKTRIIFIANPNNPTGTLVRSDEVERFLDRIPGTVLVVFDEAYDDYVDDPERPDLIPHVLAGRPVVVTRTFSKAYGLAGLRVGYAVAHPQISALLERVRSPFNVNVAAQETAAAAVGDQDHIRRTVALNADSRRTFYRAFDELGLQYVPSHGNFVLVDVNRDSRAVFLAMQKRGVIVRAGAGLGYPHHIRVTTGLPEQNVRFIEALRTVLCEIEPC